MPFPPAIFSSVGWSPTHLLFCARYQTTPRTAGCNGSN